MGGRSRPGPCVWAWLFFFSRGEQPYLFLQKKKKYTGDTSPAKANGMSSASLDGGWKIEAAPLMVRF
jgi:hypothetical protein